MGDFMDDLTLHDVKSVRVERVSKLDSGTTSVRLIVDSRDREFAVILFWRDVVDENTHNDKR